MSNVHFSSSTNSTTFTNCCGTAVITEMKCPNCNELVYPFDVITDKDERAQLSDHDIRTRRFYQAFGK